ncbi:Hypothetical predicted protein [Mytilus galloprovincialis]|uniref:Reverse transcriptase domain-containing protein n=1 Tax=Mytilus galloprovincialis TaxID=29158 RepID=A0A8B6CJQ7_MYTGA|nr:Hypothetical predicted protein [Mytilus galloprovincialis]
MLYFWVIQIVELVAIDDFVSNDSIHTTIRNRLDDILNYSADIELNVRNNPDNNTNCYGPKLISLCKASGLRILNGRHKNGFANDFTFCGANGMSVIDYLLVPVSLFPIVRQLIVSNFTTFSDNAFLHIQLSLLCNKQNSTRFPDDENGEKLSQDKFKWNDELKEQCRDCLLNNMEKINLCRERIDFDGQQLLDNSLAEFTSTLNDIMAPFFKKRTNNYKSCRSNICDDKPWFNAQCKDLHRRYINCLNIFNRLKSQLNHSNLIRAKKDYKTLERRLKREYMRTEGNMLDIMRLTNPKLFYKKFKRKASPKHAVPLKLFHEHFKSLCSSDTDAVLDDSQFHDTDGECVYEELDREITENDILKAIRNLKRDKSHGVDGILNEYFIEYKDVFMPVLLYIFNGILQSGIFPTDWAKAILIPIFKKGNVLDPNNYRGISLVSNFGKLFTSVLNQRLIDWSETFDIVTDAQFGFRPGLGTVDAIFALTSLIFKSLSAKNHYCTQLKSKNIGCFLQWKAQKSKVYDGI